MCNELLLPQNPMLFLCQGQNFRIPTNLHQSQLALGISGLCPASLKLDSSILKLTVPAGAAVPKW